MKIEKHIDWEPKTIYIEENSYDGIDIEITEDDIFIQSHTQGYGSQTHDLHIPTKELFHLLKEMFNETSEKKTPD